MNFKEQRYSMYIGRFQPFHAGHEWCVREMLSKGNRVCIAIMDIHDTEPDNNPYTYREVFNAISYIFIDETNMGDIEIIKIPPIESVNYGREVGYKIIEHIPPDNIKKISATKIRAKMREDGELKDK